MNKVSFSDIEKYGLHKFLSEVQAELRTGTYRCSAVQNVEIPKDKLAKAQKLLRQRPYSIFVSDKELIDLEKYVCLKTLAKAQ